MLHDRTRLALLIVLAIAIVLAVVFSVRGLRQAAVTPTVDLGSVKTEAVGTFAGGLTSTAVAAPTGTASATPMPPSETPTETASAATTGTASTAVSATPSCYRLKYLQDVTIPDNSIMTPAQVFTKTWQVQNSGLCAWRPGFKLILVGGNAMGGSPYVLPGVVNPGSKVELAVKMVAPTNETGLIQGTWRMTDDGGNQFGDALTVVIVIGNGSPIAPTGAATATP